MRITTLVAASLIGASPGVAGKVLDSHTTYALYAEDWAQIPGDDQIDIAVEIADEVPGADSAKFVVCMDILAKDTETKRALFPLAVFACKRKSREDW